MLKRLNFKLLLNISYLLFIGVLFIAVYYLSTYYFETSYSKPSSENLFGQAPEINNAPEIEGTLETATNSESDNYYNEASVSVNVSAPLQPVALPDLTFSSFFDSFASDHLIAGADTTLFRDDSAAAVYFPLDYSYENAPTEIVSKYESEFKQIYFNDFAKPSSLVDRRCLGRDCLEQTGIKLSYGGKNLTLPNELSENKIVAISIGSLEKRWLIGVTLLDGETYEGRVYYFDGKKFTPLIFPDNREKISTPYIGLFGFGGLESDFLVIYGAYRGLAYRVQPEKITDISNFFDFRVMIGGFKPEIIRASNNRTVNWYIYSSSLARPQLIKLWQNSRGEITGEALYQSIFTSSGEAVSFRLLSASAREFNLLAKVKQGDSEAWQILTDRGFKNLVAGSLVFKAIPVDSEIMIEKIANSQLGSSAAPCREGDYYFSSDNRNWRELTIGQNLSKDFRAAVKDAFFLRVDFPVQTDRFYSPFLSEVLFDFYYRK